LKPFKYVLTFDPYNLVEHTSEISTLTHFAWFSRISLATHALTRSSPLLTQSGSLAFAVV